MTGPGPARIEALNVLTLIRGGEPVAEALAQRTRLGQLSPADRSLMTQIVYGVLRNQRYLDAWLAPFLRGELEPVVRDILRMALFQMGFLDRVPAYAIVDAAVEQTKAVSPRATGMVNAILRRAPTKKPKNLPLAVEFSHPDWLVHRWQNRFGTEKTRRILMVNNEVPPLSLRVNVLKTSREAVLAELHQEGVRSELSHYVPEAIRVSGSFWLEDLPAFQNGLVTVQDESSMLVTWVLDPQPDERIVDLTAGLGGKTGHILERTQGQAKVTAVDLSRTRLKLLQENLTRLGFFNHVTVMEMDARHFAAGNVHEFDRVLLDAPCSNLGVLRRRSDARWKKQENDLQEHKNLQQELLTAAITVAKPGGVIVYSTCSVEPEETIMVLDHVLATHPTIHHEDVREYLPDPIFEEFVVDGNLVLLPGDLGMDGFFIARLRT
ncbi:16S rRNA (cytosine(967)-C(5))-methyltransferase RsmB [Sulfobacillus thermosulfidooxidans]|uniref:16S rRNA (cytosine(967)-C(5))-methyltransferase RsmB n=1 Tax=Sulfobacillus thermosulfidooxidans TaxID=28034 RepID=UPI0006B4100D|nr:16S rRNA (cytosine(967)-C(5))-methyltransferase RsmB [Sulfobacillus thermosulfidooxidans]